LACWTQTALSDFEMITLLSAKTLQGEREINNFAKVSAELAL
jgi:hypothetical protein